MMKSMVLLSSLVVLMSSQVHAQSADRASVVSAIKSLIPATSSAIYGKNCSGDTAAYILRAEHSTNGASVSIAANSIVNDSDSAAFHVGAGSSNLGEEIVGVKSADSQISVLVKEREPGSMATGNEREFTQLNVSILKSNADGTADRKISVEKYNQFLGVKHDRVSLECTFTY